MKKTIKTVISLVCILAFTLSLFCFNASAAGSSVAASKSSITVGNEVNVTLTFNPGEAMYGIQSVINYNSAVLEYKSGSASGGAGTLTLVESPSGETSISYTLVFKAIAAGTCSISLADCRYGALGANGAEEKAIAGSSANITVKDLTLSANANLKSLRLSAGTLSPAFSPDVTSYSVTVENSITSCKISAVAADAKAKVQITGKSNLDLGTNVRSVIVTAPNGAQKTYTINITRKDVDENAAKLITNIDGIEQTVSTDISAVTLFNGFTATTADYNGVQVAVATDANNTYKIYYLKPADSDVLVPYTYNEETQLFEKVKYFTQGAYTYIIADFPTDLLLPSNYYITNAKINETDINCYSDSSLPDFYYIYAFNGESFSYYRYDVKENNFQRFPEFEKMNVVPTIEEEVPENFWKRFLSLSLTAKIIVSLIAFVVVLTLVLLIMSFIRFINIRKNAKIETAIDNDFQFDDIEIDGFDFNGDNDPGLNEDEEN